VRSFALSSPAGAVLGGVSEEHLGEGEKEFPRVVGVAVAAGCGVGEYVFAEPCHDLGASGSALGGNVSCCGCGGEYVLPFHVAYGMVAGLR